MSERMVTVTTPPCIVCDRVSHMRVPLTGHIMRMDGETTQVAFPNMPAEKREMLISGTHPVCWDSLFTDID